MVKGPYIQMNWHELVSGGGKLKRDLTLSSTATSLKFGQRNPLSSISALLVINCSEFHLKENYLPLDSKRNTAILALLPTYPSRWPPRP